MLDFSKTAKRFLSVVLIDGTAIRLRMPTKRVFDALLGLRDQLATLSTDDAGQLAEVYDLIAAVMSNNLEHQSITSEYLSDIFDIEDVQLFFESYMAFIGMAIADPNSKSPRSLAPNPAKATDA